MRPLFIASTKPGEGKTLVALGLLTALRERFRKIGYVKPLGRSPFESGVDGIDPDVTLLQAALEIPHPPKEMGPVTVRGGFPYEWLTREGHEKVLSRITQSLEKVLKGKTFSVIEGTGNAAAGAAFGLSNAFVAKTANARVLLLAGGGIGQPIDEIILNKSYFERAGVEVAGVVVNRAYPEELEKVNTFARKVLKSMNVELVGVIPYTHELSRPTMAHIQEELKAEILHGREFLVNRIGKIVLGAMTSHHALASMQGQVTIVAPADREDILLAALSAMYLLGRRDFAVSGIVLTGRIRPSETIQEIMKRTKIPVLAADGDSYSVSSAIHGMSVRLSTREPARLKEAAELVKRHVDMDGLVKALAAQA